MKPVLRIDRIRAVLKANGPMTVAQISEITGIYRPNVTGVINQFRLNPGRRMRIRKAGKVRESFTTYSFIYELSNEPDAVIEPVVSKYLRPKPEHEAYMERKRIQELAAQSQPFRDPMLFFTAGRAP